MGLLKSFLAGAARPGALERFVDGVTQGTMNERIRTLEDALKVPYAQAMTVVLLSRRVTKGLQQQQRRMPEPYRSQWAFPHDHVFAEVLAFYYFVVMVDYYAERDCEEPGADGRPRDSYSRALRKSLVLANALFVQRSSAGLPEGFLVQRTAGYPSIGDGGHDSGADALLQFILQAWEPPTGAAPAAPNPAAAAIVRGCLDAVPFAEARAVCSSIYRVKNGPAARSASA